MLGDVISILKHAKDVQSKQDSDTFIVPEAKKVDRKVSPAPPPQVKEVPKQIEKKPETVSARLGPPKAMKFPTPIPASSGGGKSKFPLETNFCLVLLQVPKCFMLVQIFCARKSLSCVVC